MWKDYFSIVGCRHFIFGKFGEFHIDDDKMPVEKLKGAYDKGCRFIAPTEKGLKTFYPDVKPITATEINIPSAKAKLIKCK